jgi:hypothetical protein
MQGYLKNSYNYHPEKQSIHPVNAAHKMIPEMLKGIYTDKLKDPDHPVNKNLYVDEHYKVNYNIRKKVIDPTTTRGFNDYYNGYFKTLCHEERQQAVELARKVVNKKLGGDYKHYSDWQVAHTNQRPHVASTSRPLDEFDFKYLKKYHHGPRIEVDG